MGVKERLGLAAEYVNRGRETAVPWRAKKSQLF
jgi:hypothetical protein